MESKPASIEETRLSFKRLRECGYRVQTSSWLIVYWYPNNLQKSRILWNLSRKVGNAVVRNRLKRWCREFIRGRLKDVLVAQGLDLNLVFRPIQKDFYKDLRREDFDKELLRVEKRIRQRLGTSS